MLAMMVPFAIVAVLMVVLIVYGARVCMYYVSPYARCVKRGYYQAMRDPRAKLQNRLGSIVARMSDKNGPYVLFDILLPRDDGDSVLVDCAVVSAEGVEAIATVPGRGQLFGNADDDTWAVRTRNHNDESVELIPNGWRRAEAMAKAMAAYLEVDGDLVRARVVAGRRLDCSAVPQECAVTGEKGYRKELAARVKADRETADS